ncbi:hypothetical protein [Pseudoalteromonas sp. T1lg21]|uniref:hypothetical protein n=1 Tax=Pseudoalteromonas sp. T1lg21 TaxID=2077095 RepID=UPI001319FAD7|nr:hypothetical protein [Pseudoalteromonas sp. T1lg21]
MRKSSFMDKHAYPDTFKLNDGDTLKGNRNGSEVMIPYTNEPNVKIGDVLFQSAGANEIEFKVMDCHFGEDQTMGIGTEHPHLLRMVVENQTSKPHQSSPASQTFNIGNLSGSNVQVGNNNTQNFINIIKELESKIDKLEATTQEKEEAKGLLWQLMDNKLVNTVVGTLASNALKSE